MPTRTAGNMRLAQSTAALFSALDIPEEKILRFHQIHSDRLICVQAAEQARQIMAAPLEKADGWVLAGVTGWGAAILTADCVPLLIWDEPARVIGLAHCGWRGVAAGLPGKTVRQMRACGAQGKLSAWAGPHIQKCCFEVQQDVADIFPDCVHRKDGKLFVDLNTALTRQLTQEGLHPADIRLPYYCTCGDTENFFSFRRDHTKDALLTFIYRP